MIYAEIVTAALLIMAALIVVIACIKTKKPIRIIAYSAIPSGALLIIINLMSSITGFFIGFNAYTISATLILGIPGLISVLVTKLIFAV